MAKVDTYTIKIDLNNDGDYIDAGEDVTADVRAAPFVRTSRGRDTIRPLNRPAAGRATYVLDNVANAYGPASNVLPGRPTQIIANEGGAQNLWEGLIDKPVQNPNPLERSVTVHGIGTLSRLVGKKVSTQLYTDIDTSTAIGHLLDAAGWPAADRDLATTGRTTMAWWWLNDEDAFAALTTLLNTEGPGARLHEDAIAQIVFKDRHATHLDTVSDTIQTTYRGTGTEPLHSVPFAYDRGLQNVVNECVIEQKIRAASAQSAFWSLGETVNLGGSESREFIVRGSGGNPFTAAVSPLLAATDYTVVSGSVSSATLDRTSGGNATLTLTAGAGGAVVSGLQVRGQLVEVTNTTLIKNSISTAASITANGLQTFTLPIRAEIGSEAALDLCNGIVVWWQDGLALTTITIRNGHQTRLDASLTQEIGERVRIIEANSSIDDEFWVERITHRFDGQLHETKFTCEEAVGFVPFELDVSRLDSTDLIWI